MGRSIALGLGLTCTAVIGAASAQSRTEQALELLRQTLMCPLPLSTSNSGGDLTDRTISTLHFTGDAHWLSGYQTTTTRTHNSLKKSVDVTEGKIDISAAFADINRVVSSNGELVLSCAGGRNCFHVDSPLGVTDANNISQTLCDGATADNAKAAIEELIRINGGRLSQ